MKIETKRGYVKWTDENGKRHKVLESEYEAVEELIEEPSESLNGILEDSNFDSTGNGFA